MSASVGDRIRMHSNHTDVPDRVGTVVAVLGEDGPPYRVRFDSGEETIVSPGPDATFEAGSLSDKAGLAAEKAEEKAGELAEKAGQAAERRHRDRGARRGRRRRPGRPALPALRLATPHGVSRRRGCGDPGVQRKHGRTAGTAVPE